MFLSLIRRHEGWITFTLVLALVIGGFVLAQAFFAAAPIPPPSVPVAQSGDPTLLIYPDQGPPGTYIGVTGAGWPGDTPVTILLTDGQGQQRVVVERTTAADGSLNTGFLYPFDNAWSTPGTYTIRVEAPQSGQRVTTIFQVSDRPLTVTATQAVTNSTNTVTATPTATVVPSVTPTATPEPPFTATALPTPVPTTTPLPTDTPQPTATPLPTDTPAPLANQPPQVQAALVPIDIDDDRKAGIFEIQVAASDPENSLQGVMIVLMLPPHAYEREAELKQARKIEIKFGGKRLEVKGPEPQAIVDQMATYGGIIVENGQQIDLRVKRKGEGKLQWDDDHWRLEAPAIELVVVAADVAGLQSTAQVHSCLEKDC